MSRDVQNSLGQVCSIRLLRLVGINVRLSRGITSPCSLGGGWGSRTAYAFEVQYQLLQMFVPCLAVEGPIVANLFHTVQDSTHNMLQESVVLNSFTVSAVNTLSNHASDS